MKKSLDFCVFPENSIRTGGSNFTVKHLVELKGIFSIMWVCTAVLRCFVGSKHLSAYAGDALEGIFLLLGLSME